MLKLKVIVIATVMLLATAGVALGSSVIDNPGDNQAGSAPAPAATAADDSAAAVYDGPGLPPATGEETDDDASETADEVSADDESATGDDSTSDTTSDSVSGSSGQSGTAGAQAPIAGSGGNESEDANSGSGDSRS